tara:strand:- start:4987 stop:5178 length:192 start_codon:yes stop_codon:yes gene_type:complete
MTKETTTTEENLKQLDEELDTTVGNNLIAEIDNFLTTVSTRDNIPATEIQNHLLDIRAIAKNN